jgi:signal transduction histidine kinase
MEELNRLKSEFVSTVSHELRTPLTYIQGYSELLLRRRLDPKMEQEALGELYGASVRMGRLVDDLLDLSRMEIGRLRLHPTTVDLNELLQSAVAAARFQYKDHRLKLRARALPSIYADPDRLRQVIDNLLTNAHRYAPEGPILLRGRTNKTSVRIEVVDQGPGISPEDCARVFEPFFRGANSAISPLRGGGLGLSIVRKLVEAHGGSVGVETALGQGSTFWFTLPLRPAQDLTFGEPTPLSSALVDRLPDRVG